MRINSEDDLKEIENEIISSRADAIMAANSENSAVSKNNPKQLKFAEQSNLSSECKMNISLYLFLHYINKLRFFHLQ